MSENIKCPSCKAEITDFNEFKKTFTCPGCGAFLKNSKEIAKLLNRQSAKKNTAINTKNFMGVKIPAEESIPSKNDSLKPKQEPQREKAPVKKEFNQTPKAQKPSKPISSEDAALFAESNDYISPELEALYDDDDYITVTPDSNEEHDAEIENQGVNNEYFEENDIELDSNLWADSDDDDEDITVTATLATFDDDEPEYSDSDILGTPRTMSQEEIDSDFEEHMDEDEDEQEEESISSVNDNAVPEQEEELNSNVTNEEINSNNTNSDLDLFADLNAVATPQPNRNKSATSTPQNSIKESATDNAEYFEPDEDDFDDSYEDDSFSEDEYDDDYSEDYDDYEDESIENDESNEINKEQVSIATKIFRKIKNSKNSSTVKRSVSVVDINDDIGRKVDKKVFNSNKDGYYNDRQPFVEPEPDIIPSGSILKVIGIFGGLIFFTAYFIYML